jgi:hypothetical protein
MYCPPATSEAEARWPRFGLVVVATTSRRNNKDQMIRPYMLLFITDNFKESQAYFRIYLYTRIFFHETKSYAGVASKYK